MVLTLFGRSMLLRLTHEVKALGPISFTLLKSTLVSELSFQNTCSLMVVRLSGMTKALSEVHLEKA